MFMFVLCIIYIYKYQKKKIRKKLKNKSNKNLYAKQKDPVDDVGCNLKVCLCMNDWMAGWIDDTVNKM